MKKTRKNYEEYLNDMFSNQDISEGQYSYLTKYASKLLKQGKLGTALRHNDPIAFNVGFKEWKP